MPSSLANSSGIFLGSTAHCDLVRPGVALYGVNPTPGRNNPMRPVVELKGRIVQVRTSSSGETVGYGASLTAARPSRIAVVAVGYADGYLRSASASKTKPPPRSSSAGKRCPIVGRISMDLMAVDVTDSARGHRAARRSCDADRRRHERRRSRRCMGTIGYEVLTSLGRRYHRVYKA